MKKLAKILIIAVFSLVLFASSAAADVDGSVTQTQNSASMSLEGIWYNQLGSTLTINEVQKGGFTGTYKTEVSTSGCAKGVFPLVGRTNISRTKQSVGFVVSWKNELSDCNSVTAWSGQLQNVNHEDQLVTTWLLTVGTDPKDNWKSTFLNKDTFKRQLKVEDMIYKVKVEKVF